MKRKILRFLSAVIAVPVIASSVLFAKNVMAAEKTYDITANIPDYTYDEKYNTGKYFEPAKEGKYQAMIYFHGAPKEKNKSGLGILPERLRNDLNKWIDAGYCDPKVVICPKITNFSGEYGIQDFEEYFTKGYFDTLLADIKSGNFSKKIDTSKPIIVAGYSMGGSCALYAATTHKDDFYNVGAFSCSYCYYQEGSGWIKKKSDVVFSDRTDGRFYMSYGADEGSYFAGNYTTFLDAINNNGKNIPNRFKTHIYSEDFGPHDWRLFEPETFDFLYYYKFGTLPDEELTVNQCFCNITLSGTPSVGNTLTASCKSGYTSKFKYQWYRVDASTGTATAISGATENSYTLTAADKGYKIRCKVKDGNEYPGFSYKTTGVITSSSDKPALSGTVNVSGYFRYGQKLTATAANCNSSNLSYQWKIGDSNISGATGNTYVLKKEDINKYISCVVTDKNGKYTGSISSTKTLVMKGFGPAQPAVTAVDCSAPGASDGKILNVSTKMEYAKGSQDGPYKDCTGTEITGLSKGTYFVRVKETAYEDTGAITMVSIKEKAAPSPTNTNTPTPSPTNTNTPTPRPTNTNTPTPRPTNTNTPTPKATDTVTPTPVNEEPAGSTEVPTLTPAGNDDITSVPTPTESAGKKETVTPTAVPTKVPGSSVSPIPTTTASVTKAPSATPSVKATVTPSVTASVTPSATPAATNADAATKTDATDADKSAKVKIDKTENVKNGVSIKWSSSADAKSFNILRSTDGKKFLPVKTVDASVTSYTDKTAKNGIIYSYKIEAVNGKLWEQSEVSEICRLDAVKISKKNSKKTKTAYLKWKKNPKASGYEIRYVLKNKVKTITVKNAKTVSRTIKKLKSKKKYKISVRAYRQAGNIKYYGAWSKTYKLKIK